MIAERSSVAGFSEPKLHSTGSVEDRIYLSWIQYLTTTLGRSPKFAQARAEVERTRTRAKQLVAWLASCGWQLEGAEILEVGSGHGTLAVELALVGAKVTAVEPCAAWRALSEERVAALSLPIRHYGSDAHALPFPDCSFDACISLQVLEHVRDPTEVISEIARVLRPGGAVYVSCENYLAFREQHYGVPWLPGLSKRMGVAYLVLLGRDPSFLREHITYVYCPKLVMAFLSAGLIDESWLGLLTSLGQERSRVRRLTQAVYKVCRALFGSLWAQTLVICAVHWKSLFRVGFQFMGMKCSRHRADHCLAGD